MKLLKIFGSLALALPLTFGAFSAQAEQAYLAEVAENHPALAKQFQDMMQPFMREADWLANYGTSAPGSKVSIDDTNYIVYWGCKPHDCTSENYAVLVEPKSQKLVAGAFVRNHYKEQNITHSNVTWLGNAELDVARALASFLY